MKLSFFIIGAVITISGAGLSFYPVFQDFDETDYVLPFSKSEGYPDQRDLLIMNVRSDCQYDDSIYLNSTINDEPICSIAQNWVISLLIMIFSGIVIMIIGAVLSPKKMNDF